ncbi:hemolysin family protein [Deltaproteobacteria bacterium IMCC39524]|nr:hemolysin family protein [Deltaproteobacteria bacterium IMCC39524]
MEDDQNPQRNSFSSTFSRFFRGRSRALTEKELQDAINSSEEEGILNESEGDMLQSIFEFGDTIVREVMVPRTDMVCCPADATLGGFLELIIRSGHSRVPLFEGSTDKIVGVVYAKDLLRHWGANDETLTLTEVMRTPYFIPETKRIDDLLKDFRTRRVHMAIAVDEYGGTSGLITIEDLLEEIVGDIQDEYDLEVPWLQPQEDGTLLVDARANVEELEEYYDIEIPREKFDTVGGYLFHLLGNVPQKGEKVSDNGLVLMVEDSDARKIEKVRVWRDAEASGTE